MVYVQPLAPCSALSCRIAVGALAKYSFWPLWPLALLCLAELLWGLWQSFWNPVSYVAVPQGMWAGLSTMETFTGLVNSCSPCLAWVLKQFLGLCTWGISSTYIFEKCCKFMQFLVHFSTFSVPLHLKLCIKPAQKTSMAEEYRGYLDLWWASKLWLDLLYGSPVAGDCASFGLHWVSLR